MFDTLLHQDLDTRPLAHRPVQAPSWHQDSSPAPGKREAGGQCSQLLQPATARALPRLATQSTSGSPFAHPHSFSSSSGLKRPIVGLCSGVRRGTTAQTHQSGALCNIHHATCSTNTLQTKVPATGTGEPGLRPESLGEGETSGYFKSHGILPD